MNPTIAAILMATFFVRQLPNGLTVVHVASADASKVAINMTFDAGSRHDPRGRDGTAWVATRVLCDSLPGFECDLNPERSLFAAEIDAKQLPQTLEVIAKALRDPEAGHFTRVKAALTAEPAVVETALLREAYGSTPYGHPPQSEPRHVRIADVRRFIEKHYGPASGVLTIAGATDPESAHRVVATAIGRIPRRAARQRCRPLLRKLNQEKRVVPRDPAAKSPLVAMAFPNVPAGHPDWFAINILADIIGQGPQSRLQKALVATKLASSFGEGETESRCASSLFRLRARVAEGVSTAKIEEVIDRELERLRTEPVSDEELRLARQQERDYAASQFATADSIANAVSRATLFYGSPESLIRDAERIDMVSADDVLRVAKKYLRRSNRVVVITER